MSTTAQPQITKQRVNFTQVSNFVLNDPNLSLKAKGLYSYMFSKPDGWQFSTDRMTLDLKENRSTIQTILRELIKSGYVVRKKKPNGRTDYHIVWEISPTEQPKTENSSLAQKVIVSEETVFTDQINETISYENRENPDAISKDEKSLGGILRPISNTNLYKYNKNTKLRKFSEKTGLDNLPTVVHPVSEEHINEIVELYKDPATRKYALIKLKEYGYKIHKGQPVKIRTA